MGGQKRPRRTYDHLGRRPQLQVSSADIWEDLRAASKDGIVAKFVGDIAKGLAQGERVDAEYEMPFLAHATMEPMNCTVHVTPGSCEVWIGTQVMTRVQEYAAKAAGLPIDKVKVYQHLLGGGFGRQLEPDMAESAVRIGKHVDGPLKVVWTREEDIQRDVYRPVYRDVVSATLSDGKIAAWKYRISGSSVMARWLPAGFQNGIDVDAVDSAVDMPYDIPNKHLNTFAPSRPRYGRASGVALGRTIMSLPSNASWTNWRARRAKIQSNSAVACSAVIRG